MMKEMRSLNNMETPRCAFVRKKKNSFELDTITKTRQLTKLYRLHPVRGPSEREPECSDTQAKLPAESVRRCVAMQRH